MHLGHLVVFYFKDSSTNARVARPAVINAAPAMFSTTVSLFVMFQPGDRISGGTQSPNAQITNVPRSSGDFTDDPAAIAAGTPCWSNP